MSVGGASIDRWRARARSCTRTLTPSTRRSSSATTRRCAAAPSSSGAASCSRPATRPRRTACERRWARHRRAALCPDAIVVTPRMEAYSEASKAMFAVFNDTTPFVEGLSIDEAFLDVGGLRRISGTPTEIAVHLRREVLERVGIRVTVGVARTKFLAKVASGVAKPDGLLVVPVDGELAFLHAIAGRATVGRRTRDRAQAPGALDHHRRGGGTARRARLGADPGTRGRTAPQRPRAQSRSAPCGGRSPSSLDGDPASARSTATVTRDARRRPHRAGRPARPAPAGGPPRLPNGDAALQVRRLHTSDAVAHAARGDGRHGDAARGRPDPARQRPAR